MEKEELEFIYFMRGASGSFKSNLYTTILCADIENLNRLSLGFPNEVEVVRKFKNEEGYWQKILEKLG